MCSVHRLDRPAPQAALPELLALLGAPPGLALQDPGFQVPVWHLRPGAPAAREGAPLEHLLVVRSGSFKSLRITDEGYEQVLSFAFRGELLGFDAVYGGRNLTSVVALEDSTLFALPVLQLDGWRQRCPPLGHALQSALSRCLVRSGEVAEMMAPVSADVRLARFLSWLSRAAAERGESARRLRLRMNRRDIASLLGVAHETVSRSFSSLVDQGCLAVDNREVEIVDIARLQQRARCTRMPQAEAAGRVAA